MARMGGERKEGDVMTNPHDTPEQRRLFSEWWERKYCEEVHWNEKGPMRVIHWGDWYGWLVCRAANAAEVAELVGLLRRVDDAGSNLIGCDLMADIKAAIAKHGGNA